MKRNLIFLAALLVAIGAQAQTAFVDETRSTYVGVKCPQCPQPTDVPLLKWNYMKEGMTETLTNPDVRGSIMIDWATQTVTAAGQTFKIEKYEVSAFEPLQAVYYASTKLSIYYNPQSQYQFHTIE